MIGAIRQENGKYTLTDISYENRSHSTYNYRKKIKELGGIWDGKHWIDFPEDKLKEIGASKRLKVRVAPYQNLTGKAEDCFTFEYKIKNNRILKMDMGDCWVSVEIEEIYGEA